MKEQKEGRPQRKKPGVKTRAQTVNAVCGEFEELTLSSEHSDGKSSVYSDDNESEAECPKCGLVYGDG